mmetsp:Transcript_95423/g.168586  ORF Transcript_95423/g.168586 Transcript_95423/m.168586 type:complete len:170 (+) Transcript_95423:68-577(+)
MPHDTILSFLAAFWVSEVLCKSGNNKRHFRLQPNAGTRLLCCCRGDRCWQSPVHDKEDWAEDGKGRQDENGHKHMDGSKIGYGDGEATNDWGTEHGENSEWTHRVGDTCYWKDRDGPRKPGDPEDCSHSFHPNQESKANTPKAIKSAANRVMLTSALTTFAGVFLIVSI